MVSKKTILAVFINLLFTLIVVHLFFQIAVYGTGLDFFYKNGISGFSIGKTDIGEEIKFAYPLFSQLSPIILVSESLMLIFIISKKVINRRKTAKNDAEITWLFQRYGSQKDKTPLDVLYYILRDKKHLRLETLEKVFKVNREIAKSWCYTLESGNLATLRYPTLGDPEIVLN
jgi:hypothetical protein